MSAFLGAREFVVNDSQLIAANFTTTITINNNTYLNGQSGIDILREASALEAAHDSFARPDPARCFPGTREQYLKDIISRATPSIAAPSLPIYWMKGPAGVGKTAIAQTYAERLKDMGALGASFFFSAIGQRKPESFFPSIAYQLSTIHPAYRDLINSRIHQDNTLVSKAMQFQFQYLINEPLRDLRAGRKGIRNAVQIVVDGLDECEGTDVQCEIIRIIGAAASQSTIPLRWTFFSRSVPHIEASFSTAAVAPYCYKTILPISRDADGEIELYIRSVLNDTAQRRNPLAQTLWPSSEEMKILVRGAGGLFIYAATVVRFICRSDVLSPQKRLLAILSVILERRESTGTGADAPFAELDKFYTLILQRVPTEAFSSVHMILALLCRLGGFGAMYAANTLGLSRDEFESACQHASAVVGLEEPGKELELDPTIKPSPNYTNASGRVLNQAFGQVRSHLGGQVRFYHKSFYDFLLDPTRSNSYCIKTSKVLMDQLVKVHLAYDRNFSWNGSDLVILPSAPELAATLSYPHEIELVNSVLTAWVYALAGDEDPYSFPAPWGTRGAGADRDFRKWLYTRTNTAPVGCLLRSLLWDCETWRKYFRGVRIEYTSHNGFPKSVVARFKMMIKWREKTGIIRQYHPTLSSHIKSILRDRSREGIESALYRMGHTRKAIFWYWEINHNLRYYRSFRSIDLAEGEKRFQEEDFDSWPKYGYEYTK